MASIAPNIPRGFFLFCAISELFASILIFFFIFTVNLYFLKIVVNSTVFYAVFEIIFIWIKWISYVKYLCCLFFFTVILKFISNLCLLAQTKSQPNYFKNLPFLLKKSQNIVSLSYIKVSLRALYIFVIHGVFT